MKSYIVTNRKSWDDRAQKHFESEFYDVEGFLAGNTSLNEIEIKAIGDVQGKKLLHLQCHFGQDTLSWARAGAIVTGVDLSTESIKLANQLKTKTGLEARFIESNVYTLPEQLDEKYDIVFTSYGTIVWLPDLDEWAKIIHHYLKEGGIFCIADFHPVLNMFDHDNNTIAFKYFSHKDEPYIEVADSSYTENTKNESLEEVFWSHPLSEILQALKDRGLQLQSFKEYDYSPYNCFANMKEIAPGKYVFGNFPVAIPHVYSIVVQK